MADAVFLVGALAFFLTGGLLLFAFDLAGVERLAGDDWQHSRSRSNGARSRAGPFKPDGRHDVDVH